MNLPRTILSVFLFASDKSTLFTHKKKIELTLQAGVCLALQNLAANQPCATAAPDISFTIRTASPFCRQEISPSPGPRPPQALLPTMPSKRRMTHQRMAPTKRRAMTKTKSDQERGTSILDLPLELREMIYGFYIQDPAPTFQWLHGFRHLSPEGLVLQLQTVDHRVTHQVHHDKFRKGLRRRSPEVVWGVFFPALSFTCKSMYLDFGLYLLRNSTIRLWGLWPSEYLLRVLERFGGDTGFEAIRKLNIRDPDNVFLPRVEHHDIGGLPAWYRLDVQDNKGLNPYTDFLTRCSGLRSLYLCVSIEGLYRLAKGGYSPELPTKRQYLDVALRAMANDHMLRLRTSLISNECLDRLTIELKPDRLAPKHMLMHRYPVFIISKEYIPVFEAFYSFLKTCFTEKGKEIKMEVSWYYTEKDKDKMLERVFGKATEFPDRHSRQFLEQRWFPRAYHGRGLASLTLNERYGHILRCFQSE